MSKLTDAKVRNAKPREKAYKLSDGLGMYLYIQPSGAKYWRAKYFFQAKERVLSLGVYPEVSLKKARDRWFEARRQIEEGIDPTRTKAADIYTLNKLWAEFLSVKGKTWAESHRTRQIRRMELHILPKFGKTDPNTLTPPMLLDRLRRIEKEGTVETAHRVLNILRQLFTFGIAMGRMIHNPASDLKSVLERPTPKHYPAVLDELRLGQILRMLDDNKTAGIIVSAALRLLPLVFQRPGEFRQMKWDDVDLENSLWTFKPSKQKQASTAGAHLALHTVPLSRQAIQILKDLQETTGHGTYVFPSPRTLIRPMSDGGINAGLRSLGIPQEELTGHSWRSIARTKLDESLGFRPDIIEQQLAHSVKDSLGRAYNRTTFLAERKEMMQAWADYLDDLKLQK